jgi:SAM-dependent methyltransferase
MQPGADSPNADQIAYWNSEASVRWLSRQQQLDAMLEPLMLWALDQAAPRSGEQVVDVGCGCGASVLELARRVGPSGAVVGVDVSEPMLGQARERVAGAGFANTTLMLADASTAQLGVAKFDLVFSRFGVMFFRNPVQAFANLKQALKPEGRIAFVCWQPLKANPVFLVPLKAAGAFGPPRVAPQPDEPGPFAFGDPERVRRILGDAGLREVMFTPHDLTMRMAGPGDVAAAEEYATQTGPVARVLADLAPEARAAARAAVRDALRRYDGPDGIALAGAIWLVTARS